MLWLEPPKGFSVNRHLDKVKQTARMFRLYEGKTMSDAVYEEMVLTVAERMHYRDPVGLRNKMRGLVLNGDTITDKTLMRVGMFLLEHGPAFSAGGIPPEWAGSPPAWFVSRIVSVTRAEPVKGLKLRYVVRMVALNGPLAGNILRAEPTFRYAMYLPKMIGVPKRTKHEVVPQDAIGMVAYTKFGTDGVKSFTMMEIQATSSMKTRNKRLFERRNDI